MDHIFYAEHLSCFGTLGTGLSRTTWKRVNAIDKETALLVEIAPEWSAEAFYLQCTAANPDITKGSEHYVTRYLDGPSPRVVKATIPGGMGDVFSESLS